MPWAWPADRGPQSDLGASPLSAGNQPAVLAAALGWSSAAGLSHLVRKAAELQEQSDLTV